MSVQTISVEMIDPNPYQPKTRWPIAPASVESLANDIRANGLIQTPTGRRVNGTGRVQLGVGHRRFVAWQIAFPGQPIPIDIQDFSDKTMFDHVIAENAHRQDLSAIEKANEMVAYMAAFGVTQTEAARQFNLSQSAASNLIRLLKLPAGAREHVHAGNVPERLARQWVQLADAGLDKAADEIAAAVAQAEPDQKEKIARDQMDDILRKATRLDLWPVNWAGRPEWKAKLPAGIESVTCALCKNCLSQKSRFDRTEMLYYCALKKGQCYQAKEAAWAEHELAAVSKKSGIPIAAPDEKVYVLKLDWGNRDKAEQLFKKKNKCLRLVLHLKETSGPDHHKYITGSPYAELAATVATILEQKSDELKKAQAQTESPAERKKREAAEAKQTAANRAERAAMRKSKADIAWMMWYLADTLAPQLSASGGILELIDNLNCKYCAKPMAGDWLEYDDPLNELLKQIKAAKNGQHDILLKKKILVRRLAHHVSAFTPKDQYDLERAKKKISTAVGELGLQLPAGWDAVPIHLTLANCHVCGKFTSLDHITKIDEANGWQTLGGLVTCSDACRATKGKSK